MSHWVSHLNPEQREAALHNTGPMLILAGAGSGKTTVLVSRTGRLIEEKICSSKEICVLTFTNKAAKELQKRVTDKLGKKLSKGLWAGTFHSFGLQILRQYHKKAKLPKRFGILSQGDQTALVKELLKDFVHGEKDSWDADKLLSMISSWRNRGQTRAKMADEYEDAVEWLLPKYIKRLQILGVVDFDELLLAPIRLAEQYPEVKEELSSRFKQLMVDEFQDTNHLQMKLVMLLASKYQNISVVGDDDQSIYGWRGAEVKNILSFPHLWDDCKVVRLERNYRSTPQILAIANEVIKKNEHRHDKVLKSQTDKEGSLPELFVYETEDEEAERVCTEIISQVHNHEYKYDDFAILYRSNSQGALIEAELRKNRIPYNLNGGTAFFDRRETKDILAYLRCALNPNEISLRRIINVPTRGVGDTSIDKIQDFREGKKLSFEDSARNWKEAGVNEKAGQGLEDFFRFLDSLIGNILEEGNDTCGELLLKQMEKLGYKSFVSKLSKDDKQALLKWQIVEIFCNVLDRFVAQGGKNIQSILEFVDAMELRDQLSDDNEKDSEPKVQLLTFHASKGLEYPICFMLGLEEDIIPHRTLGEDISEERRLFYVAVTRAKEKLIMSRAKQRRKFGRMKPSAPSRFLLEIPDGLLKEYELGFRPVNENQRKSMLSDLFSQLDKKIESNNLN